MSPPTNITPEFLGSGNVKISWDPPDGPINGYQLFYNKVNDVKEVVNITGSNISYVTLFSLEAAATYVIDMLAYADLPTELSDSIYVTLNGQWINKYSVCHTKWSVDKLYSVWSH